MRVDGHDLSIELPDNWHGRIVAQGDAVVLEAATVRLGPVDRGAGATHEAMGTTDAYLRIVDTALAPRDVADDETWSETALPLALGPNDLSPVFENVSLPAYGAAFRIVKGRCLSLYAGFGPHPQQGEPVWPTDTGAPIGVPVAPARLAELNDVLATLDVGGTSGAP
jgi:hypothetical protein